MFLRRHKHLRGSQGELISRKRAEERRSPAMYGASGGGTEAALWRGVSLPRAIVVGFVVSQFGPAYIRIRRHSNRLGEGHAQRHPAHHRGSPRRLCKLASRTGGGVATRVAAAGGHL